MSKIESPRPEVLSVNDADDLLSQLAGDEVDQLLSETEVTPRLETEDRLDDSVADAPLDELYRALPSSNGRLVATTEYQRTDETAVQAELDDLFHSLKPAAKPGPRMADEEVHKALEKAMEPAALPAPDANAAADLAAALKLAEDAEDQRLRKLAQELELDKPVPAARQMDDVEDAITEPVASAPTPVAPPMKLEALPEINLHDLPEPRTPWYLLPLELVNRPAAAMSDQSRGLLGKAAIVTLFNGVCILGYVWLVRKHR